MSYISNLIHAVFVAKYRQPTLTPQYVPELSSVIAAKIQELGCKTIIVDGVENHLHLVYELHSTVALSNLMRIVKSSSSYWAHNSLKFPLFGGWESEYGAFSFARKDLYKVYEYVCRQREHHAGVGLEDEFKRLVMKAGLTFYRFPDPPVK